MRAKRPPWLPAIAILVGVCAAGCHYDDAPDLLSVHRLDPSRAAAGDRVMLTGDGFPEGRRATVIFRGDVFRPGLPPESDVRITVPAAPAARNAVVLPFDKQLEARFVGKGIVARHATFHGDVRILFDPNASGMAPVGGTAHDVRFDVLPSTPEAETSIDDGTEAAVDGGAPTPLAFLGASATLNQSTQRLEVTAVDPQGRAASAGLLPGDQLVEIDGVTVLTEGDLRSRPGQRVAYWTVERGGRQQPALAVDVEGLAPRGVSELVLPAAILLSICVVLGVPVTRAGVLLRWLAQRMARRRPRNARVPSAWDTGATLAAARLDLAALGAALLPPGADRSVLGVAAFLVLGMVTLAFVRLSLGHPLISVDLDLSALTLGSAGTLLVSRFAAGGRAMGPVSSSWSLVRALGHAGRTLACVGPGLLAIAGTVLASGRFVLAEMVTEQGGAPWRWAAFRNPGLFILSIVLVASTIPEVEERPLASMDGLQDASGGDSANDKQERSGRMRSLAMATRGLAEWAYLWIACGLAVGVFFGGWRLPGVSSVVQEASRTRLLLGAALFIAKLQGLVAVVGSLRALAGRVPLDQVGSLALRWVLPLSAVACAFTVAWTAAADGAPAFAIADLCGYATLAVVAAFAAFAISTALNGRRVERTRVAQATVNPWL